MHNSATKPAGRRPAMPPWWLLALVLLVLLALGALLNPAQAQAVGIGAEPVTPPASAALLPPVGLPSLSDATTVPPGAVAPATRYSSPFFNHPFLPSQAMKTNFNFNFFAVVLSLILLDLATLHPAEEPSADYAAQALPAAGAAPSQPTAPAALPAALRPGRHHHLVAARPPATAALPRR